MDTWVVIMFAALLIFLILSLTVRRANRGVDPTQLLFHPDLIGRVRAIAEAGQKLPAIKLLRDGTPGLSLAAAKIMVDKMAAAPARRPDRPAPVDISKDSDGR